MLRQQQNQKLSQKLSPQQIQLMKLLQVPTASLEQRIKEELEMNPALEVPQPEDKTKEEDIFEEEKKETEEKELEELLESEIKEHLRDEDEEVSDYHIQGSYSNDEDEDLGLSSIASNEDNLHDFLMNQLGLLNLNERQSIIAFQVIGSIDDDGYLRREPIAIADDLAFHQNLIIEVEEIEEVIEIVKSFDPPGVGAKDLQECLILQLERFPNQEDDAVKYAIIIVESFFEELTKKHFDRILTSMQLEEAQLKAANEVILKLTPKPGSAYSSSAKAGNYIIPDFFIKNNNGQLELTLNARNAPELRVSNEYINMLKAYDETTKRNKEQRDALLFIKQKVDAARWFIDAIIQRQRTLLLTMHTIMEYQKEFFLTGDEMKLRPMILKDIATKIDMDNSTVSRVANSKYVQTEYGTFILKFFFSESMITDSGEEISTREVKLMIEKIINEEDKSKPYSDERIMQLLSEKGYTIARRTVAKYREGLNIPVARLRRGV